MYYICISEGERGRNSPQCLTIKTIKAMKIYCTRTLGPNVIILANSISEAARIASKIKKGKIEYYKQSMTEPSPITFLSYEAVVFASNITKTVFMKRRTGEVTKFE